jgi:hypothetical protein
LSGDTPAAEEYFPRFLIEKLEPPGLPAGVVQDYAESLACFQNVLNVDAIIDGQMGQLTV